MVCKKTKDGYRLESGRLIKYDDLDFASLSSNEFKELADEKASFIEIITIKQDINKILGGIEDIKKSYKETEKELKLHTINCPIRDDVINNMIDKKINNLESVLLPEAESDKIFDERIETVYWKDLKNKILSGSKLLKAAFIFIGFIITIILISGFADSIERLMNLIK